MAVRQAKGSRAPQRKMRRIPVPFSVEEMLSALEARYGRPRFISRFDPLEELISCILSQHTSDANSFPAFTRLRAHFNSWHQMVEAGPDGIKPFIAAAGLANNKSKSIIQSLEKIRATFGDYTLEPLRGWPVSDARNFLLSLPGVGPKTAAIVLCFGFGKDAIPVDTHVSRVSRRLGLIRDHEDDNRAHDRLLLQVPPGLAWRYHVTLIQHGRHLCRAPVPDCEPCPIQSQCRWFRQVGPEKERARLKRIRRRRKPD